MGIKYFASFLAEHSYLKCNLVFNSNGDASTNNNSRRTSSKYGRMENKKIIVWDVLSFRNKLTGFGRYNQHSEFLCDLFRAENKIRSVVDGFKSANIEVIAFIDGYHCKAKVQEKKHRVRSHLCEIRKNIRILKCVVNTRNEKQKKRKCSKCSFHPFVKSSVLAQMLTRMGITVYRGSGNKNSSTGDVCDIDQDIVKYCIDNYNEESENIVAILTADTDFYGFKDLPKNILIGHEFNFREKKLHISGYYPSTVWQYLLLQTFEQKMQLIATMGNDFVGTQNSKKLVSIVNKISRFQSPPPKMLFFVFLFISFTVSN